MKAEGGVNNRPMVEADMTAVMALENSIFPDPWPDSAFSDQLDDDNSYILVAESGAEILAYACLLIISPEGHLTNIAVAKEHRRKSVASLLLDGILKIATERESEYLLLEVRPSNMSARNFYKKHGFDLLYQRPNYYRRPVEDAMVLVHNLDSGKD